MVDVQSAIAEIRPGKKDRKKKQEDIRNHRTKILCPLLHSAAIIM